MPRYRSETITTGDQSWLGSVHALYNARSVAADPAQFPVATYTTGVVPSGTPLGIITTTGKVGPYATAATDGRQNLKGFLVTDQPAGPNGNASWPMLEHGRIRTERLPVAFTAPATPGLFTFYVGTEV